MCRLSAYLGPPVPISDLVYGGDHSLAHQSFRPRELLVGHVNADGFGVVWSRQGSLVRAGSTRPIWQSRDLRPRLETERSGVVLAAVRNTTPGIPNDASGIPPLLRRGHAFVLNGYVGGFARHRSSLLARLGPELPRDLVGLSDTEVLFFLALAELEGGASPGAALRSVIRIAVEAVAPTGDEALLNLALTDGTRLAVARASSSGRSNSLYRSTTEAGGCVFASEPFDDGAEWSTVPHDTVLDVSADAVTEVPPG